MKDTVTCKLTNNLIRFAVKYLGRNDPKFFITSATYSKAFDFQKIIFNLPKTEQPASEVLPHQSLLGYFSLREQ